MTRSERGEYLSSVSLDLGFPRLRVALVLERLLSLFFVFVTVDPSGVGLTRFGNPRAFANGHGTGSP